jgi:hypothetical protein
MGGVGAFDHPAARMGVIDVNRKGQQYCGQLLIEGILGLSCLTRRGRRIGPANPRTVRWEGVGACCSSCLTNGSVGGKRKSRVADTLSHLV